MSGKGLPDDPNLLRVPREFVEETEELEFTREDLPLLVLRLPRFARTFFEALFAEELGLEINGMNDAERQRVSAMTVSLEGDEEHDALLPLLYTLSIIASFTRPMKNSRPRKERAKTNQKSSSSQSSSCRRSETGRTRPAESCWPALPLIWRSGLVGGPDARRNDV